MRIELIIFSLFLIFPFVNSVCVLGFENTSTLKECVKNTDINIMELMTFDGNRTFDFDLNITIYSETDNTITLNTIDMNVTDRQGLFYKELIGGISQTGEYSIIIDAEHKTPDGFLDGNVGSNTYNLSIIDQNIYQSVMNVQTSVDAIDTATTTANVCLTKLSTEFNLGEYLYFTFSGFDTNNNKLTNGTFDLYWNNELILNDQALTNKSDFMQYVSTKKFNNDIYTLIISSNDCLVTRFCSNLKGGCW